MAFIQSYYENREAIYVHISSKTTHLATLNSENSKEKHNHHVEV